jgi:hypothetical protein
MPTSRSWAGERPLTFQQPFASFDDYWNPFLVGQGPAGTYVASLAADQREALRDRLRRLLVGTGAGNGGGPFVLTARAWAVKGSAPPRSPSAPHQATPSCRR